MHRRTLTVSKSASRTHPPFHRAVLCLGRTLSCTAPHSLHLLTFDLCESQLFDDLLLQMVWHLHPRRRASYVTSLRASRLLGTYRRVVFVLH